jgi:tetratricopeptide (TPR) repeat protein
LVAFFFATNALADDRSLCLRSFNQDVTDDALPACTRILEGRSRGLKRDVALLQRSAAWFYKGEIDIALGDINEAIRINPRDPAYFLARARFLARKGDTQGVLADFASAIKLRPNDAVIYSNRGVFFSDSGDQDAAIADFNHSLRIDPGSAHSYKGRSTAFKLKGDLDQALTDASEALRILPGNALFWAQRGDISRFRGDLSRARSDFDRAIELAPDFAIAFVGRGLVEEREGRIGQARRDFQHALTLPLHKYDTSSEAQETARARLAALDSGEIRPTIPSAPLKATNPTSIPTPAIVAPIVETPVSATRLQAGQKLGRRVALVIGNSAYQKTSPLINPRNDAAAVAASLRNIGFDVVSVSLDATREKLVDALRAFARESDKAEWAMVYYAGHGIEVNGQNYMIPVDAALKSDRDVQFEAVPIEQVMSSIDGARRIKLVVLDACRDNPFAPTMQKTGVREVTAQAATAGGTVGTRSVGRGLGEVKVSGASLVVFAAKHGQTALDGDGGNSPFAIALVQRIATPGVEINKIFRLVRDDVMEATAGRQEPYTYGSLPGREDFYFVSR